jgi:hypothetical protein
MIFNVRAPIGISGKNERKLQKKSYRRVHFSFFPVMFQKNSEVYFIGIVQKKFASGAGDFTSCVPYIN